MANIGDPFGTTVPPVSTAGPGYATSVNDILTEVMARLSVKVPLSSLNVSTNLDLVGQAAINAGYINLQNTASTPTSSPVNRITAFGGNFWWVGPSGAVQITNGSLLNAAGIGGITGDYGGSNPAQFRFSDVNSRYDAFDDFASNTWAYLRARGLDLPANSTSNLFARLQWAGSTNQTYTLPAAASSSGERPLYMNAAGAITVGHPTTKTFTFSAMSARAQGISQSADNRTVASDSDGALLNLVVSAEVLIPLSGLPEGFSITSFNVDVNKNSASTTSFTVRKVVLGTPSSVVSGSSTATGFVSASLTPGSPEVVAANTFYYLWYQYNGMAVGERLYGVRVNGVFPA